MFGEMDREDEGKVASIRALRRVVKDIENEKVAGVLLTYKDGEMSISLLNVTELEATNMLMHAASLAHDNLRGMQ